MCDLQISCGKKLQLTMTTTTTTTTTTTIIIIIIMARLWHGNHNKTPPPPTLSHNKNNIFHWVLQLNIRSAKMFCNITLHQNYFRVPAKCHLRMNKQMTVEHNKIFKISIQLHVSTSQGHHQAGVRTFLKRIYQPHLLEMRILHI